MQCGGPGRPFRHGQLRFSPSSPGPEGGRVVFQIVQLLGILKYLTHFPHEEPFYSPYGTHNKYYLHYARVPITVATYICGFNLQTLKTFLNR